MRSATVAVLVLLAANPAAAQEIHGIVLEDDTGSPIAGVTVELLRRDSVVRARAVTNASGWFEVTASTNDRFLLRVTHPLYRTIEDVPMTLNKLELVNVTVRMGRATIPLEPLVVAGRSRNPITGFRARAAGGVGRYIRRAEIERRRPNRPMDLFKLESGVRLERVTVQGVTFDALLMQGYRGTTCVPTLYMDGMALPAAVGTSAVSLDDVVTVEDIEGVEIYRTGLRAPMELHVPFDALNDCGVIAVWTRSTGHRAVTWERAGIAAALAGAVFLLVR